MLPRSKLPLLAAIAAAVLFAAACADNAPSGGETGSPTPTPESDAPAVQPAEDQADVPPILDVSDVVQQVEESVVRIEASAGNTVLGGGVGTGFIVDPEGFILTNNHVIAVGDQAASSITVTLFDGSRHDATVIGRDPDTDTALLQIPVTGLAALPLGSLDDIEVGDPVVAFGFALDLAGGEGAGFTVTTGILSSKNRVIREEAANILGSIQTDAAINPGNSGGPLVDIRGRVVGMNTAIASNPSAGGVAPGIGFAVGVDTLKAVYDELRELGRVDRGFLGIANFASIRPAQAEELGLPAGQGGILVGEIVAGGPAEAAGLQAEDVVVRIGDYLIETEADLIVALIDYDTGDEVEVEYYRGGESRTALVTLGEFPA